MARLTRDFSGKHAHPAAHGVRLKLPAHAKALLEKRAAGELIGLLRVAVDDWQAGWEFDSEPDVARVVCPPDADVACLDFGCAVALDCLVLGGDTPERFNQAVAGLFRHGAASVWVTLEDGFWRVLPSRFKPCGFVAMQGPLSAWALPRAVRAHREAALLLGEGVYASPLFQPVRDALLASFGIHSDLTLVSPWPPAPDLMDAVRDAQADCGMAARQNDKEAYAAAQLREAAAWRRVEAAERAAATTTTS